MLQFEDFFHLKGFVGGLSSFPNLSMQWSISHMIQHKPEYSWIRWVIRWNHASSCNTSITISQTSIFCWAIFYCAVFLSTSLSIAHHQITPSRIRSTWRLVNFTLNSFSSCWSLILRDPSHPFWETPWHFLNLNPVFSSPYCTFRMPSVATPLQLEPVFQNNLSFTAQFLWYY